MHTYMYLHRASKEKTLRIYLTLQKIMAANSDDSSSRVLGALIWYMVSLAIVQEERRG